MDDQEKGVATLTPGGMKERIATQVIKIAKLPSEAPVERGWAMFVSVIIGVAIFLVGVGILYVALRVYLETKGAASSLPILAAGAIFCAWGGNHASKQLTNGGIATSLSALVSPIRKLVGIGRGKEEEG